MNPMVSSAIVVMDKNWTKYNSLQLELRRRLVAGLLVGANYTYGIKKTVAASHARVRRASRSMRRTTATSPHAFKMNWDYEIPIGRGQRFGVDMNPVLDAIVGNWQFSGNGPRQDATATG